jgi:hypothetical protein
VARGGLGADRFSGGAHRRAGGEAVVDDDRAPAPQLERRAVAAVRAGALVEHALLRLDGPGHRVLAHTRHRDDVVVQHSDPAGGDGAHRQLLVSGHAQLAHEQHVERRSESPSDARRDRHAAAGQPEDDDRVVARTVAVARGDERAGELVAGRPSVAKAAQELRPVSCSSARR